MTFQNLCPGMDVRPLHAPLLPLLGLSVCGLLPTTHFNPCVPATCPTGAVAMKGGSTSAAWLTLCRPHASAGRLSDQGGGIAEPDTDAVWQFGFTTTTHGRRHDGGACVLLFGVAALMPVQPCGSLASEPPLTCGGAARGAPARASPSAQGWPLLVVWQSRRLA